MATYYWVGGSGTWNNASNTNWSASSGGAGGAGVPNNTDTVIFDANSGTAATVTVAGTAAALTVTINKSDINLSLSGSPTISGTLTFTAGTITLGSNTLTVNVLSSNNSNARTIAFGTGKIVVKGNNTTIVNISNATNLTVTGIPLIESDYSGATGTRTFSMSGVEANAISIKVLAGTDTVAATAVFKDIDFTGFAGTLSANLRTIFGNLTLSTGMTLAATTNITTFSGSGTKTIACNGKTMDFPVTFDGAGGTFEFSGAFAIGATRTMRLANGTLDAKNQNVSLGTFSLSAGTKTLTLGSGTWTCALSWTCSTNSTGLTVSPSTGTISMTSASAKTFSGGGFTWPTLNQGGAGALTIEQSNTFANITNSTQPATITLTAGTTQTVNAFSLSGTAGNQITLNSSSAGSVATLYKASGKVSVSYINIRDVRAEGPCEWNAREDLGAVDQGNTPGWNFIREQVKRLFRRIMQNIVRPMFT